MIILYMYHTDFLVLQMRYPPQAILRYISLLIYCDLFYLAYYALQEERGQMTSKVVEYVESPYTSYEQDSAGHTFDLAIH